MAWMDHLLEDVRAAVRGISKYPVACGVAILSLAGGIGATTATLIVRDVVFHRPPALYRDPDHLSRVQVGSPERPIMPFGSLVPGPLFTIWQRGVPGATLAAAAPSAMREVRVANRRETVRVRSVTAEFFPVLGVDAAVGRTFSAARRTPDPTIDRNAVVLSHRIWRTIFDGRSDAIGATIWIDSRPHTIAGVMPERFWFSEMDSPLWTLLEADAIPNQTGLEVVVRRRDDVSASSLAEKLQIGLSEHAAARPAGERDLRLKVSGLGGTPLGHMVSIALPWLLGVCVLLTLLISCANVAILVIAQWTAREHEIAIRASLGASRRRIIGLLLTESILIAVAGGALGICTTYALRGVIVRNAGDTVRFFDLSIDPAILLQAMFVTLLTGVVAGIGPALLETRRLHGNPMRTIASSDRVRQRWRHALVVMEIAVTVALLVVTAGMVSLYQRSFSRDVGYRTEPLLGLRVENSGGVPVARVLDAVKQVPGVAGVAATTSGPFLGAGPIERVSLDAAGSTTMPAERATISPDFFATLDVPLRAGRAFTDQDSPSTGAVIVNELLATRLFPGRDPIGKRIWVAGDPHDIVGVAAFYLNGALQNPRYEAKLFVPMGASRREVTSTSFLIRATGDPNTLLRALREPVRDAAAGNVVASAFTVRQIMNVAGQEILTGTAPLAPLIMTGMFLTAAGIYGVLAFAITRRSKELAVRVAIGASRVDLACLVAAHSLRLVTLGVGVGIGFTFAISRIVRASGGAGSMLDPPWQGFVVPVLIVLAIAAVATAIPSRRAMKIDPAVLLRTT